MQANLLDRLKEANVPTHAFRIDRQAPAPMPSYPPSLRITGWGVLIDILRDCEQRADTPMILEVRYL